MNEYIKRNKYKDIILYAIFGVLTTIVNIGTYWIIAHQWSMSVMFSTVLAWIAAVLFAYITNRKWVFHSKTKDFREICRELTAFFACRLATGIIDWICMFVFVDIMQFNDIIMKTFANVMVIVLNYVASRFIIFKK